MGNRSDLIYKTIVCFFISFHLSSRNLVPNPGFEEYTACPSFLSQIPLATPWFLPTIDGSSDYFNSCSTVNIVKVPANFKGYQPARTGNAYGGFILYGDNSSYREYLSVKLIQPMLTGQSYCVSMYINKSNNSKNAISQLGIYFSTDSLAGFPAQNLPFTPQLTTPAYVFYTDTLNWTLISFNFTADTGHQYMTIGNFNNVTSTLFTGGTDIYSYYYIDDVSVYPAPPLNISLGTDTALCTGQTLLLNSNSPSQSTYLWQDNSTNPSFLVSSSGNYCLTVTNGCSVEKDTIEVAYISAPQGIDIGNDTAICGDQDFVLALDNNPQDNYLWSTGETTSSITTSTGEFWVIATNFCGSTSDTINVGIRNCENDFYVPNTFTPNGDGLNDFFSIIQSNKNINDYYLSIFDRWGNKIFESRNINESWDGKYRKELAQQDVYIYAIKFTGHAGELRQYVGHVNLIR